MTGPSDLNDPGRFRASGLANARAGVLPPSVPSRLDIAGLRAAYRGGGCAAPPVLSGVSPVGSPWVYGREGLRAARRTAAFEVLALRAANDPGAFAAIPRDALALDLAPAWVLNAAHGVAPSQENRRAVPAAWLAEPWPELRVGAPYDREVVERPLPAGGSAARPLWEAVGREARRLCDPLRVVLERGMAFFAELPAALGIEGFAAAPDLAPVRTRGGTGGERCRRDEASTRTPRVRVPLEGAGDLVVALTVSSSEGPGATIQVEAWDRRTKRPASLGSLTLALESGMPLARAETGPRGPAVFRGVPLGKAVLAVEDGGRRWELTLEVEEP